MRETHATVEGSRRVPLAGAWALGLANPHSTMEVTLKLRRKKQLPVLVGRPATKLTRQELAATYGARKEDIAKVSKIFQKLGLRVTGSSVATRTVVLAGTVAAMEQAFDVKLINYAHENGDYRGRVGNVHVPVELETVVQGVFGLDNRCVVRRRRQPVRDLAAPKALTAVPASWFIPSQLAAHYNFPSGDGGGQTVGLFEFGGGYFAQDLQKFCQLAKVQMPVVQVVSTDGTSTTAKDGAEGEVMLDIEIVAGLCPKSTIVVYFANFTEQGWITILDAAMQDQQNDPGVISVSWGFAEDQDIWTPQAMTQINESLQEAAHLGITVCLAAGDDGSSDAIADGNAHADFPASSPFVLSVGGTTITTSGSTKKDIVWKEGDGLRSDNGGSTGGGVSAVFPRPSWQANLKIDSVNAGAIAGRCLPDVAANADWDASPYLLVVDGQAEPNGGTSAATPLWAGLVTLLNAQRASGNKARLGYLTPLLYQGQNGGRGGSPVGAIGCTDILTGDNVTDPVGGYHAESGYDAVSGWGTPDGAKLLSALLRATSAPTSAARRTRKKRAKKK